jgi:hypothetical protein
VPQALRLAMLRLARRPALDQSVSQQDVADGLQGVEAANALGRLPCHGRQHAPPPRQHLGVWRRYEGLESPATRSLGSRQLTSCSSQ